MRIIDKQGRRVSDPDLDKGKLVNEKRVIFHRYEIEREEEGHHEVVAEYPNGGKDVKWVVDVPEAGKWVAYDESGERVETDMQAPHDAPHDAEIPDIEEFQRYVALTDEEIEGRKREKVQDEIARRVADLRNTDYVAIKIAEGAATREDYADVIAQRQQWRDEINRLEDDLRG